MAAFLVFAVLQTGCKKNIDMPQTPNTPTIDFQPVGLPLKSTSWGTTATEYFTYNTDGSLKQAIGGLTGSPGQTRDFTYQNGKLVKIVKSNIKEDVFSYNSTGKLSRITETLAGGATHGTYLEFDYLANGNLKTMKYYEFDGPVNTPKATSTYEYDAQGLPQKITLTYPGTTQQLVYTFTNYSTEVQFTPWALLSSWELLQPDYCFYNYPMLSRLTKLPGIINRKLMVNNTVQESLDREFTYTITGKQLQKIQYLSNNIEVVFHY